MFNKVFAMMFLHTILYMIILQTTFLHVYHLKDDICFRLNSSLNNHVYACALQRRPCLWLLSTRARASALYVMGGRKRLLGDAYIPKHAQELSSLRHGVWDSRDWGAQPTN